MYVLSILVQGESVIGGESIKNFCISDYFTNYFRFLRKNDYTGVDAIA